jgi:hypothetical protein
MVSDAFRKKWRENWLFSIFALTCLNYQKRVWIDAAGKNIIDSFIQANCIYFDDLRIGKLYAEPLAEELVSREEYEVLESWHTALADYQAPGKDDSNDRAVLEDLKWQTVLRFGVTGRRNLKIFLSKEELCYLEEIEHSFVGI